MKNQPASFWNLSASALYKQLDASPSGLSGIQARERLSRFGPNRLQEHHERALILQFIARFNNPLVIILLVASAIAAFTGDATSTVIITFIVVLSVTLDFIQEYRAGRAVERLQQAVALRATAWRDGRPEEIAMADLVPGDVVLLAAGDLVPGDGRVL